MGNKQKTVNNKQRFKVHNGLRVKEPACKRLITIYINGFSLIEVLVVMFVFSILSIVVAQTLAVTLRGSRKSESQVQARENIQYAISVIDRSVRNARRLTCSGQTNTLSYIDEYGVAASFQCVSASGNYYIASNSARLTSDSVNVTNCVSPSYAFTCIQNTGVPDEVNIAITAIDSNVTGAEGSSVSVTKKILLRNY
jgi:prepilin-type N-terminal cleavage/methylation domain-containing protein